jgi:dienelactone hydrolase
MESDSITRYRPLRAAVLVAAAWGGIQTAPARAEAPAPPFYADKANLLAYIDAAGRAQPVRTPADWQHRRRHILDSMQLVMGPLPPPSGKVPLELKVIAETRVDGLVRRKISFAVEKGDRLPAWLLIPADLRGKAPAALCLHQTTAIGKDEPAGLGGGENLHYGLELARRGYVTLCPDYPNYGEYKCDAYAAGYASTTMKAIWNHMRAMDVLESLSEVDGLRIGCIGHSLGGHNAVFLAVFDNRVKAVVSSCGFNAFPKYGGGDLSGWSHRGYMPRIASAYGSDPRKMPFDFTEALAAIAPRPVFVNAPRKDANFEVSGVKDCLRAAAPVYALLGAGDKLVAEHPDAGHDFPPAVRKAAYEFLDAALRTTRRSTGGAAGSRELNSQPGASLPARN